MAKVIYDENKLSSSHLCGQCLLRGDCPLKEGLKKMGIVDDADSKSVYCSYFKDEEKEGGTRG